MSVRELLFVVPRAEKPEEINNESERWWEGEKGREIDN